MKKQNQIKNEKSSLVVGYVAPGWPLSDFPNGIVAYIQNIVAGLNLAELDLKITAVILARVLKEVSSDDHVINLSNYNTPKPPLQKLLDKVLYKIKLPFIQSIIYARTAAYLAKNQYLAVQQSKMPIDILEMEESFGFAGFLTKICKVPVVVRLHGPNFLVGPYINVQLGENFKLRVLCEGKAIKNAHGITSPSLDVLEKVRSYYGLALPNARVIPNPVSSVAPNKRWQYRTDCKPSILFVGRFDSVKGGDLILEAFRLLALNNQDMVLYFVGPDSGLVLNGQLIYFKEYLDRFIVDEHIYKRIHFLGHCDSEKIAQLRKDALITVFPSRYENFPVSLLEALAAGCPTVATAVGGIKEIIVNDYNGLLAESESPQDIADKVLMLMSNPTKMQLLSNNAIEDCNKRFSPEVVAVQTVDYYQSVLARVR